MDTLPFYIVDVFGLKKFTGNQLAVFLDAGDLSASEMQVIAQEMNFSESTFILSRELINGGYDVRIFTPESELPFAGHPTLGTAWVIREEILKKPIPQLNLNLKVGQIPVTFQEDLLWMKQGSPTFSEPFPDRDLVAQSLQLDSGAIDPKFPIQEVSTGLPFLIVPLRSLRHIKKASISHELHVRVLSRTNSKGMLLFCPETEHPEHDLHVRMFAPLLGVPEDPATGSANGCLAAYLVKHHYFGSSEIDIIVEQGFEMNRPSLLYLRAKKMKEEGEIEVQVGGKVYTIARGDLFY